MTTGKVAPEILLRESFVLRERVATRTRTDAALAFGAILTVTLGFAVCANASAISHAAMNGMMLTSRLWQGRTGPSDAALGETGRPGAILVQADGEFAVKDATGRAGRPLAINVTMPPFQSTDYVLLSFRGLPREFSMSSGFRTAEAWLVSAQETKNLWLIPPKDFVGKLEMEVQLIRGKTTAPLVDKFMIDVRAPVTAEPNRSRTQATSSAVGDIPPGGPQEVAASPSGEEAVEKPPRVSSEKEKELMRLAASLLEQNDIAAARLIYARLAREGSVEGALILAETYDPSFLSKYDIMGLEPDMEQAKYWYGVAAKLGSEDASTRLTAMESGGGRR